MQFYSLENGLVPKGSSLPGAWNALLIVLSPEELSSSELPASLLPQKLHSEQRDSQLCWYRIDQRRIEGAFHIPPRCGHTACRISLTWADNCILIVDHDRFAEKCIDTILAMRPHFSDGPDNFLADFLVTVIKDDPAEAQQLDSRLSGLEQAVLSGKTDKFIHQISAIRKDLNRNMRFYTQLEEFALSLQTDASDLFDSFSAKRLSYFLRRVHALREEMQILREYATQISSEYQSQVDILQNHVMKLLTIVTTLFLPLSLIVGWYGMNFANMPELSWTYGYPAIIAVSVIVILVLVYYFKKKKWF